MWQALGAEEKKKWEEKAKQDKERFKRENDAYEKVPLGCGCGCGREQGGVGAGVILGITAKSWQAVGVRGMGSATIQAPSMCGRGASRGVTPASRTRIGGPPATPSCSRLGVSTASSGSWSQGRRGPASTAPFRAVSARRGEGRARLGCGCRRRRR